jgi:hypothetical protein
MYSVCLCVLSVYFCVCLRQNLSSYKQISLKGTAIGGEIRATSVHAALLRHNVTNTCISDANVIKVKSKVRLSLYFINYASLLDLGLVEQGLGVLLPERVSDYSILHRVRTYS